MGAMKRLSREELVPDMAAMYDECLREAGDARLIEVGANTPELLDWYFNSFYKRVSYEGRVDFAEDGKLIYLREYNDTAVKGEEPTKKLAQRPAKRAGEAGQYSSDNRKVVTFLSASVMIHSFTLSFRG